MSEKARLGVVKRDHALPPLYIGKYCYECRHLLEEPTKNYCSKWLKVFIPDKYACRYFSLPSMSGKKISILWQDKKQRINKRNVEFFRNLIAKDSRLRDRRFRKSKKQKLVEEDRVTRTHYQALFRRRDNKKIRRK